MFSLNARRRRRAAIGRDEGAEPNSLKNRMETLGEMKQAAVAGRSENVTTARTSKTVRSV